MNFLSLSHPKAVFYILLGIHDFEFFLFTAIMDIFAFKAGVVPNGPQQYLIGLSNEINVITVLRKHIYFST